MRTCQQLYEDCAIVLYHENVLAIRIQFTIRERPGRTFVECQLCFLDYAEKFKLYFHKWVKPSDELFTDLADPSKDDLELFNSIRKFYRVRLEIYSDRYENQQSLFWTCRLLQHVLDESSVYFKFRTISPRGNVIHKMNNLSACKILRCSSVQFEHGSDVPPNLSQYLSGQLQVQDPWPLVYRIQKIVKKLPTVKRVSFRDYYDHTWRLMLAAACRYEDVTFSLYHDELLQKSLLSWLEHWRHTELKWADRQIREAKEEITALLRSHEGHVKLVEDQKEHKKKIFWQKEEAAKKVKRMIQGGDPQPLGLPNRRFHIAVLSDISTSDDEMMDDESEEEGRRRASESRVISSKRAASPSDDDVWERETRWRRTE